MKKICLKNMSLILLLSVSILFSACTPKVEYIKSKPHEFQKASPLIDVKLSFETKVEANVFKVYKEQCRRKIRFYEEQIEDYERKQENASNR